LSRHRTCRGAAGGVAATAHRCEAAPTGTGVRPACTSRVDPAQR